jgi:hypothetical protein
MPLARVLQHIRCEPPGLFSEPLRDRGFLVETVEMDEGGRLPDWREVGLVLAMGGPTARPASHLFRAGLDQASSMS